MTALRMQPLLLFFIYFKVSIIIIIMFFAFSKFYYGSASVYSVSGVPVNIFGRAYGENYLLTRHNLLVPTPKQDQSVVPLILENIWARLKFLWRTDGRLSFNVLRSLRQGNISPGTWKPWYCSMIQTSQQNVSFNGLRLRCLDNIFPEIWLNVTWYRRLIMNLYAYETVQRVTDHIIQTVCRQELSRIYDPSWGNKLKSMSIGNTFIPFLIYHIHTFIQKY